MAGKVSGLRVFVVKPPIKEKEYAAISISVAVPSILTLPVARRLTLPHPLLPVSKFTCQDYRCPSDVRALNDFLVNPVLHLNPCSLGIMRRSRCALTPEELCVFRSRLFRPNLLAHDESEVPKRGFLSFKPTPLAVGFRKVEKGVCEPF